MPTNGTPLHAAEKIGHVLCQDALWWDGRCTFTTDDHDQSAQREWGIVHRTCTGDLYDGTSGIAVFLARLAQRTGDKVAARTARAAMLHALADTAARSGALFTGSLGTALAAAMVGEWTADAQLIEESRRVALARARTGRQGFIGSDVMAGLAGGIAGAVALARRLNEPSLLTWALDLGDGLISTATRDAEGWHWPAPGEDLGLCGLSHGAAGVAWALAELAAASGEQKYAEAARKALAHESHWFDAVEANWPDLSPECVKADGSRSFSISWCHGAPGIALTRARLMQLIPAADLPIHAHAAAQTTQNSLREYLAGDRQDNFSLCHGLAGNADALLYASRVLGDEFAHTARSVMQRGVDQFGHDPRSWPAGVGGGPTTSPTLMWGLAGTGYFLLRVEDPDATPCILLPGA